MGQEYRRVTTTPGVGISMPGIIIADDFSDPFRWDIVTSVGDDFHELDPNYSFAAKQSLYLQTRTTGAAQNDDVKVRRRSYLDAAQKFQTTIFFRSPDLSKVLDIKTLIIASNGVDRDEYEFRFQPNTPDWAYLNSAGNYAVLAGGALSLESGCWHRLSFTVDLNSRRYRLGLINHIDLQVPLVQGKRTAIGDAIRFDFVLAVRSIGAAAASCYFSNFLIQRI